MKKFHISIVAILAVALFSGCTYKRVQLVDFKSKVITNKNNIGKKLTFGLIKPSIEVKGNVAPLFLYYTKTRLNTELLALRDAVSREMEKTLLKKGITVSKTYESLNDMTYSQKKKTTAIFTTDITITLNESGSLYTYLMFMPENIKSLLTAKVEANLVSIEPLSNEKVWIKSMPTMTKQLPLSYDIPKEIMDASTPTMIVNSFVPSVKQLDSVLLKAYDNIVHATQKYVSLREFLDLNSDIKKLKNSKRY